MALLESSFTFEVTTTQDWDGISTQSARSKVKGSLLTPRNNVTSQSWVRQQASSREREGESRYSRNEDNLFSFVCLVHSKDARLDLLES